MSIEVVQGRTAIYGKSHAIWNHTVHPAAVTFPPYHMALPQAKLVLDLATPEGCKAELT